MTKPRLIAKSFTKRVTAAALVEAKARNGWSNADAGDALGCSEGTVRLRCDGDDVANQMTVHELLRVTQADGAAIANRIFGEVGHRLTETTAGASDGDALGIAAAQAAIVGQLIEAMADQRIDAKEAAALLPQLVTLTERMVSFKAHLRAIIEGER